MRKKILTLSLIITLASIFVGSVYNNGHSNSSGAPSGFTGSPGDGGNTCANSGCHSGITVGTKSNVFTSNIPSDGYVPGTTYTITATARSSTNRNTFGFQISPQTIAGTLVGTMIATNAGTKLTGAGKYLTHDESGNTGVNGVKSWSFNWVAPAAGTGNVTFYGIFNHANGNGSTSGDSIFKSTFVISEKVQAPNVNLGGPTGIICNGSFKTLDAGNPGSTYIWRKDNIQIATTRTINATSAGKYKVVVTNQGGASAADSIQLSLAPAINISLPDRNLCNGDTITLDAGNAGSTYLWSNGATTQTINVSQAGTYSVKVTNNIGCEARDTSIVTGVANPVVNLGDDKAICIGDSVILDAGNGGAIYLWSTGATTQTISVKTIGTYSVTVTNLNNCTSTDEITINNNALPNANFTHQSVGGLYIQFDANPNTDYSYLWDFGDPSSPSNTSTSFNPVHEYTANGTYIVKLTVTDATTGCRSTVEDTVVVLFIGINNSSALNANKINVSPNPFFGKTNISYTLYEPTQIVSLEVLDNLGRKVSTLIQSMNLPAGKHSINYENKNASDLSGIYFIRLIVNGKTNSVRMIELSE